METLQIRRSSVIVIDQSIEQFSDLESDTTVGDVFLLTVDPETLLLYTSAENSLNMTENQ